MKRLKKLFILCVSPALQASSSQENSVVHPVTKSWYSKMLTCWEGLGTNIQLAIQLCLLLVVFYALSCLFQCKKKGGCETSCNCGCAESCNCKPDESGQKDQGAVKQELGDTETKAQSDEKVLKDINTEKTSEEPVDEKNNAEDSTK